MEARKDGTSKVEAGRGSAKYEDTVILDDDEYLRSFARSFEDTDKTDTVATNSSSGTITDMEMGQVVWLEYCQAVRQAALARRIFASRFDSKDAADWTEEKTEEARIHDVIIGILDSEAEALLSRDLEQRLAAGYISNREHVRAFPEVDVSDITSDIGRLAIEMDWATLNDISGLCDHQPLSYQAWVSSNRSRSDLHPASLPCTGPARDVKPNMINLKRFGSTLSGGARKKMLLSRAESDSESEDVWLGPKVPKTEPLEPQLLRKSLPPLHPFDSQPSEILLNLWSRDRSNHGQRGVTKMEKVDDPLATIPKQVSKKEADIESRIKRLQEAGLLSKPSAEATPTSSRQAFRRPEHCPTHLTLPNDDPRPKKLLPTKNFFEFQAQLAAGKDSTKEIQSPISPSSAFWSSSPSPHGSFADSPKAPRYISAPMGKATHSFLPKVQKGDGLRAREELAHIARKFLSRGRSVEVVVSLVKPSFPMINGDDLEGLVVDIENELVIEGLMNYDEDTSGDIQA